MMRVLHYIPSIDRASGGVGFYMQLLAKELGLLVDLHVATVKSDNELELENSTIHYISSKVFGTAKAEWCRLLDELKPDVVHVNCCWMPMCAFTQRWAQELGYKVVLTPHGMLEPWIMQRNYWTKKLPALLLYQRRAVVKAECVHATAESERVNLLKLGYNRNISIVPNGVDVESIEMKSSWSKTRKILFLSRVHVKKGIEFLIEAAVQLRSELEGYEFIIAGEGETEYIDRLRQSAATQGVGHMFNFCGGVYGEKKWELFREADIFVLPTYSENFGIVVAEALASGTPVITTTGTPWSELNEHKCGWCVDCTQALITSTLQQAISVTPMQLAEMGRRGRALIENGYSTGFVAREMWRVYDMMVVK